MNQVAIITGASRGIGKSMAFNLAQQGYSVMLLARNEKALQTVRADIKALYDDAVVGVYPVDVSDPTVVDTVVLDIIKKHQRIDVLFNNAGIFDFGTSDIKPDDYQRLVDVNLMGAYHVLHAVVPQMKQQKAGYIFNVASISGHKAYGAFGAYSSTKFGLVGLSRSLFNELLPFGIKVTSICPDVVDTPIVDIPDFPAEEKIQTDDIDRTVNYLLSLGDSACVESITVWCKRCAVQLGNLVPI